jgi:hypothetical protein
VTTVGLGARREIAEGLGSFGRIKIVAFLSKHPNEAFTRYALATGTGLKRRDLKQNLDHLVAIGWVKEHRSSYPKYQLNLGNERARLFAEFLQKVGYTRNGGPER